MFGDLVRPWRPGPDDFRLIAIVVVPGFDMQDFVAVCREPADCVFRRRRPPIPI